MRATPLLMAVATAFCCLTPAHAGAAPITSGTQSPSADESAALALINRFRADPQGELSRILGVSPSTLTSSITASTSATGNNGTTWSSGFWSGLAGAGNSAAGAMDYFHVNPGDLLYQWQHLAGSGSLAPYMWNGNLGQSAQGYADIVVADNGVTPLPGVHTISPYSPFSFQRYSDAGYTSGTTVGENIARDFDNSVTHMHAGFAIDWGLTANGIQSPSGHRNSMLDPLFTEAGIGIVDSYTAGKVTQVQHFGDRSNSAAEYVWGYAWQGSAGSAYSYANHMQGVDVSILDASNQVVGTASTDANGGYILDATSFANGAYTVKFSSGGSVLGTQALNISNLGAYTANFVGSPSAVPEPSTWALMMVGIASLALTRRAQRR